MSAPAFTLRAAATLLLALTLLAGCASGGGRGSCSQRLNREVLDRSLELGTQYMLANQKRQGNFIYAYRWVRKGLVVDDNQVRQAGAAWGLGLIYHDTRHPTVGEALERSLVFFDRHSRLTEDGLRFVVYPEVDKGKLGAVALVALAHIEYLRAVAEGAPADPKRVAHRRERLREYLGFLQSTRMLDGRFHGFFDRETGRPHGPPGPYADGETLLAFTKAAKYLGRDDLREAALDAADSGWQLNVLEPCAEVDSNTSNNTTKGFYQWGSMAFFEIATSDWPDTEKYGDWLIELANWMIDVHRTLRRPANTGYAYEGIIPAYRMAELRGDEEHVKKFGCVIETGLEKLTSWQVGSPIANEYISKRPTTDPLAVGGVQSAAEEPLLRIDTAQHQLHAVIMARRYYYPPPSSAP